MNADLAHELLGKPASARPVASIAWFRLTDKAISFTIHGQPASKSNRRKFVFVGKGEERRPAFIKSAEALQFERDALLQIPSIARQRLEGPVCVTLRSSTRPSGRTLMNR